MKLPVKEPLCSNNIDSVLARDLPTTSELALDFARDSFNVDKRTIDRNLQQVNLSLAQTTSAPLKIREFEPNLSAENRQLEDMLVKRPIWFKILVIEDDDLSRDRLCQTLRGEDTQVIEAKDSNTGINLATSELPDLIVCELMMPTIDGYDIKYFLRNSSITKKIPLLFITTHLEQTDPDSGTILIPEKGNVKPVAKKKLLSAIVNKLVSAQL